MNSYIASVLVKNIASSLPKYLYLQLENKHKENTKYEYMNHKSMTEVNQRNIGEEHKQIKQDKPNRK